MASVTIMRLLTLASICMFSSVAASSKREQASIMGATPKYPTHSGTTKYCTWWWDNDGSVACNAIPEAWSISMADFLRWNPGLGPNCENFLTEWSYCVEAIGEPPASTTTGSGGSPPTTTSPGGISTPTPTQPGMVDNCDAFFFVKPGTSCTAILTDNGITLEQLVAWNSGVGKNCESLWANVYVCVSIVGHEPNQPPTTSEPVTTPTKPTNGIETPVPTQPGMVDNCDAFAFVDAGKTCDDIAGANGISFAELLKWNPSIGNDCKGLWAKVYVCVSTVGHTPPTKTTSKPTPTNGVQTPTPTQEGMVRNCKNFHLVRSGQTCQVIADLYKITLQNFLTWNPAAKKDCTGLWSNTYACVGLI